MYLIYRIDTGAVINIEDSEPSSTPSNCRCIQSDHFKKEDVKKYDIRVVDDSSIFSTLKPLSERKVNQLELENIQQGIELSEREIREIVQGVQISELEIQLLELQLGGM